MESAPKKILAGLYLFVFVLQVHSIKNLSLCLNCRAVPSDDSKVVTFCNSNKANRMYGRCCVSMNQSIVFGLDLTDCGIKNLQDKMFKEYVNVDILMLENNSFTNYEKIDFFGLKSLNYLSIPNINSACPGGEASWNNITVHDKYVECQDQRNSCDIFQLKCPNNSFCGIGGPGYAVCSCEPGFYGYKCKRTGVFPMDIYLISTVAVVALFSALLWLLERRKLKIY